MGSNHKVGGSNPSRGTKLNESLVNSFARWLYKQRWYDSISWLMADVAQLVERRVVVPNVAGSIPVVRPN